MSGELAVGRPSCGATSSLKLLFFSKLAAFQQFLRYLHVQYMNPFSVPTICNTSGKPKVLGSGGSMDTLKNRKEILSEK